MNLGAGKPIVYVPKNDVSSVPLRGAVAVLSEKFKPGTMSDGALLQGAYQAGADAVIKIGGGGLDAVRNEQIKWQSGKPKIENIPVTTLLGVH